MAELEIRRRSALEGRLEPGDFGTVCADGPRLMVRERPALAIAQVEAWPESAAETVEKIGKTVGVRPSRDPLVATVAGETTALWVGPDSWLLVEPESARGVASLVETLAAELGGQAALTDQGHGRVCLRISGPALTDVLAKGCTLDLDPGRDFDPGRVVGTSLGHMTVTMHRVDEETADLYVARSFAVSFLDWLMHAAAEYGVRVEAA
ncbi:MAG: sarcosine oxidase subunit gamma family protein [Marivibrio sp.]|uniref:sarcosine oxidase subunit gamma n=1 Tax=Marivibrio sp. TaxID=2039719 RepID=UPI0032EBB018